MKNTFKNSNLKLSGQVFALKKSVWVIFAEATWRKCDPPHPTPPSSREKGQVDDAICGLEGCP